MRARYPLEEVPVWCHMHPNDHQDGIGGCWGISYGYVAAEGEQYCKKCELYRDNVFPPDTVVEEKK